MAAKKIEVLCQLAEDFTLIPDGLHLRGLRQQLLPFKGQSLLVTVEKLSKKRSDRQNRYYWGVVVVCVRAFWKETEGNAYTPEEAHIFITTAVLGYKIELRTVAGVQLMVMQSKKTSEMTTGEFEEAMTKIRDHFADLGCVIPEPHQENFLTDFITE